MKFQPDKADVPSISGYGPGWVRVDADILAASVVIGSRGQRFDWGCTHWDALTPAHFEKLAQHAPELVIFGSGDRIRFPRTEWLKDLYARQIGVETMDTAAACRTYNILASEGRDVLLALLIES
jgi:uncharacterized protein